MLYLFALCSSAYDVVLRQKVAVKKLSRPFQSLIHSRRSYRELRLLKHMKHENVSAPYKNTQRQTDVALWMFFAPLLIRSASVSVSAGNRAARRLHTCCHIRRLQWAVNLCFSPRCFLQAVQLSTFLDISLIRGHTDAYIQAILGGL